MLACLVLLANSLFSQADPYRNELGFNLGWGNPFGASIQYTRALTPEHAMGAAIGLSLAGQRFGLDYKRFYKTDSKMNPYLGLAVSYAEGLSNVTVSVNSDSAKYKIKEGVQITPRAGIRYRAGFVHLYLNGGYGIPVAGGGVAYQSGSKESNIKKMAEVIQLGGLEISGSLFLAF
ncbi:MAG: hypothetical protein H6686_09235 [Fibrobacteria bacterium]|nr:hypothetical protein [Fibrobacteria bacterium]